VAQFAGHVTVAAVAWPHGRGWQPVALRRRHCRLNVNGSHMHLLEVAMTLLIVLRCRLLGSSIGA
jgi:hypothetical protein